MNSSPQKNYLKKEDKLLYSKIHKMLQVIQVHNTRYQSWHEQDAGRRYDGRRRRVERTEGALVAAAHLADAQRVQGCRVPGIHEEPLRSHRLNNHGLPRSR